MEEACTATYAPVVEGLEEVEVVTGEEDEDLLYSHLCLLYRFDAGTQEWKGRGRGDIKVLKHKETGTCRMVLREDKTFKVRMNTPINTAVKLALQAGSDKAFVWSCTDYSEGNEDGCTETFACKFKDAEIANTFKHAYENSNNATAPKPVEEGKGMTSSEVTEFIGVLAASKDPKATIDKYASVHGVNSKSVDGFTMLMYAIAIEQDDAVAILAKYPGVKLEVKSGQVWNFEWEESYYLNGMHDANMKDEMKLFDSQLTALMIAGLMGTQAAFETLVKTKASLKCKTAGGKDMKDVIKGRYDTEGGKFALTKVITPEERKPRTKSIESPVVSSTPAPAAAAIPAVAVSAPATTAAPAVGGFGVAPAAGAFGAAGFAFSSTPSFNFSWGKAAEEKKATEAKKAVEAMPTDIPTLKKQLLAEKEKNEKIEQKLEDALLELQDLKKERKLMQQELKEREQNLAQLMEQMNMAGFEGDEGDEGDADYGGLVEDEDDLE